MSKFCMKIDKIFKNQKIEDFKLIQALEIEGKEKNNNKTSPLFNYFFTNFINYKLRIKGIYQDNIFLFDTKDYENNCLYSKNIIDIKYRGKNIKRNKTLDFIYNIYFDLIKKKWEKNDYIFLGKKFDFNNLKDLYKKYKPKANKINLNNEKVIFFETNKESKFYDPEFNRFCFIETYYNKDEKNYIEILNEVLEYKSLRSLHKKFQIFDKKLDCTYVKKNKLGNSYFLEALSVLSNYSDLIYQLFPNETMPDFDGIFTVCLFVNGEWKKVYIDDYFFFIKGTDTFAFCNPINDCIYSCILEKAYAKVMGSYVDIYRGCPEKAFQALTGFPSIILDKFDKNNKIKDITFNKEFINYCLDKLKEGSLLSCSSYRHLYSLLNIYKDKNDNDIFLTLRNPWRLTNENIILVKDNNFKKKKPKYDLKNEKINISHNIENETNNNDKSKNEILKNNNEIIEEKKNGIFTEKFEEFKSNYDKLIVCESLFNSTIYSYKIELNKLNKSSSFIFFKIEVNEDIKIGVDLYQNQKLNECNIFYKRSDLYSNYSLKNEFNEFKKENYEYFYSIQKGIHFIKIDISKYYCNESLLTVTLIVKGKNYKIFYLKDNENNPNLNKDETILSYNNYIYEERIGKIFEKYQEIIDFIQVYHKVELSPSGKGYYVETIISSKIITIIFITKKDLNQYVGSMNLDDKNIVIVGKHHKNGEIYDLGAYKDLNKNKIFEAFFKENHVIKMNPINEGDNIEVIFHNLLNNKIFSTNAEISVSFYMDRHELLILFLNKFECNICQQIYYYTFSFVCKRCQFYLCYKCYICYHNIIYDKIKEIHIGFAKIGPPVQGFTDFALFIPRIFLPSNPITHKVALAASLYIKTTSLKEIVVEFGEYNNEEMLDKNNKRYKTYYWKSEKNGLRFAEMNYDDYKYKKLDYDGYSDRIFKLYPGIDISLFDALKACDAKDWTSDSYDIFDKNSKDFVAYFLKVTKAYRREGEEHRGSHNLSSAFIPKCILEVIEENEDDGIHTVEKIPLVGPVIEIIRGIIK